MTAIATCTFLLARACLHHLIYCFRHSWRIDKTSLESTWERGGLETWFTLPLQVGKTKQAAAHGSAAWSRGIQERYQKVCPWNQINAPQCILYDQPTSAAVYRPQQRFADRQCANHNGTPSGSKVLVWPVNFQPEECWRRPSSTDMSIVVRPVPSHRWLCSQQMLKSR